MKTFLRSLLLLAGLTAGLNAAEDCCKEQSKAGADTDQSCCQAASTEAKPGAYPLETCVVSGDKLEDGDMGPPVDYIFKQAGQPDRLVRLCCSSCIKTFNKTPEKYLKLIDEAAAAKARGEKPKEAAPSDHGKH
jgi:hypothetical protein